MSRHVGRSGVGRLLWRSLADLRAAKPSGHAAFLRFSSSANGSTAPQPALLRGGPQYGLRISSSNYSTFRFASVSGFRHHPGTHLSIARCVSFAAIRSPPRISSVSVRPTQLPIRNLTQLAISGWKRSAHSTTRRRRAGGFVRNKSSASNGSKAQQQRLGPKSEQQKSGSRAKSGDKSTPPPPPPPSGGEQAAKNRPLLERLPHFPQHMHRPTKAELLEAATGFWSRVRVHFKWFSIKSMRPFNMDDISAFFSWILLGHVVWIIVGTTTFFSLAIFLVNTVFAQETLARWIGNYLTKSSGAKVVFESAIVPKWKDGVISFKRVFVSRRPGQGQSNVSKGSQTTAAAAAAALAGRAVDEDGAEEEDTNYTQFDLSIDNVNVTLSFTKWFNGKGLLKDVEVKGVRGVVDRSFVVSIPDVDPRTYKHEHNPGDFELDSFKMEDLLVTVYQPGNFRPFSASIYSCDLPQLRKQFLFYDFLSANNMSGSYDNSLFTIHPRQTHNYTGVQLSQGVDGEDQSQWKKQSRIRIDGLNIDHLNRGVQGPFSWIHEGNVDIVADIMFPADNDESIAKVVSEFYDRMEATVTSTATGENRRSSGHDQDAALPLGEKFKKSDQDDRCLVLDLRVHLNDVRAAVPLFTNDISYVNNALIRPIVAYINSKRTFIPVNCRVVKRVSEFDGSWTIYDSGLMDDLSREVYEAFARDVLDDHQVRRRRFKKVGIWTIQLAAQALFIGLAGNIA
ncbi:hypothetical protein BDY21DRAFT_379675 [Lineolata rhizophorae]|uniref:Mitochondrial distribution and morphology protein family 31/32 n=1 Tax=Lineolata rhizophorae TaxID=578093 RepID=A0A6A6NYA1_9PEZI|nr:hypothetical protein BDY21DRAFT_379675 [Lineolata rhizophorae]